MKRNMKKALVIFTGIGYEDDFKNTFKGKDVEKMNDDDRKIDMLPQKSNYVTNIRKPLELMGYEVNSVLITNKHKLYDEYVELYDATKIDYDDITEADVDTFLNYYKLRCPQNWGMGYPAQGGRLLKLKEELPKADLYIFIRGDVVYKQKLNVLNIDIEKINYLWPETDYRYYQWEKLGGWPPYHADGTPNDEGLRKEILDKDANEFDKSIHFEWWEEYNRVNGNTLHIVPSKYINMFISYYWLEHISLHLMLKDCQPYITLDDIHFICGMNPHLSSTDMASNPIYEVVCERQKWPSYDI
tara:strand:+ start:519 stop:1418 length:900 start_codon:yes stop_codon:yes gene_type:complete